MRIFHIFQHNIFIQFINFTISESKGEEKKPNISLTDFLTRKVWTMLSLQNITKKFSAFVLLTSKMSCLEQWRFCGIWAKECLKYRNMELSGLQES